MLELKVPPVLIVVITAVLIYVLGTAAPDLDFTFNSKLFVTPLLVVAGLAASQIGVNTFLKRGTTTNPMNPGKASALVTSGVYSFSRNPMYMGMLLALGGWAVWQENYLAFLSLPVFVLYMNRFQIKPEERVMEKKFGEEYRTYKSNVRRWL